MKISKNLLILSFALAPLANATVSFNLKAETLKTSAGAAAPTTTLAFLVADTGAAGLGAITPGASTTVGSFLSGTEDQILAKFDLSTFATAGVLSTSLTGLTIAQGTPLALVWFPTLTSASTTIAGGTSYGSYVNGGALDGGSAWTAPANGTSNYKLFYYTSDATTLHAGGANTSASGNASFTVAAVPEPSRVMLAAMGLGALVLRRRRQA